jgi:hypothetical protein
VDLAYTLSVDWYEGLIVAIDDALDPQNLLKIFKEVSLSEDWSRQFNK